MQIVTYLSFTLLSVFIQFSVIGFIQGRLKIDENPNESKGSSQKRQLRDVLKGIDRPHALYYSTKDKIMKHSSPAKFISNSTLTELLATTDLTTTIFDILYDENTSSTEESFTTESLYTTPEFENVTEITFLEKHNETTKIDVAPKKTIYVDCSCNLLIRICDIECCCDQDCSDSEIKLFPSCGQEISKKEDKLDDNFCLSQLPYFDYGNGLFCIVQVNLPKDKAVVVKKTEPVPTNYYFMWKDNEKSSILYEFTNTLYKYGDPVWLYKNSTIYHMDLPIATVNSYCTGRKVIEFLKDAKYKCNVKIQDLEMFQIMKNIEEVSIISATPLSMNSSYLNCSNLYCVNWTIVVCENFVCNYYKKNVHDPTCTESFCTNLAPKIQYIFYYHDSKITNATVKFHLQNVTTSVPLLSQDIEVKFVLGNESINKVLKLSGNPGYLDGLPIIVSYEHLNYTEVFCNISNTQTRRHLILPENINGLCTLFNSSENYLLFGRNRRIHCRYNHKPAKLGNATSECHSIQNNLNRFLELYREILVSPLGNPQELKDMDWVSIEKSLFEGPLYGQLQDKTSKLLCYNLVSRYSVIFGYVQTNRNNRIISANFANGAKNATFNMDDVSIVITIDISFIEVTNPSVFEYVTGDPSLNIHLPDDFFYPFRSNESPVNKLNMLTMILYTITIISCK